MEKYKPTFVAIILFFTYALVPSPARAGALTDQIRKTVEEIIAILKDPKLKSDDKAKERRDLLRQAVYARFDFTEMSMRSLGRHWRRLTPEERKEFVKLFADLLERTYSNRIESFNDERFIYLREILDGDFGVVKGRVVTEKGEEYTLNYKARLANGEWKVYDVVVENISLVNNYRSQFKRVIRKKSYEELISIMKEKQIDTDVGKEKEKK